MDLERLIVSIEKLKPSSRPHWGKMSAAQMLKHCNRHTKIYCNPPRPGLFRHLLTLTIGKLHLCYVKYYINYDIDRYTKNAYAPNFLKTSRLEGLDFNNEKNNLIQQLKFVF